MNKIMGKYKKRFSCGIILIFALLSILCVTSVAPTYWAAGSYEFARPNDKSATTITAVDFLEGMYLLDDVEKQYLTRHENFKFTYSDDIPTSTITSEFANGTLSVSASDYRFTAANGRTVTWVPQKVFVGDREIVKNGNAWTTDVVSADGDIVTIQYTWGTRIAAADINSFLNKTRNAAINAKDKIDAEEARYQQEVAALHQYEDDLKQYESDLAAYNRYLKEYGAWKRAHDAYAAFLEDYAEYLKELEEYNNYDAVLKQYQEDLKRYQQYKAELEIYKEKLDQYNKDIVSPAVKKAMYQLSVLAYINKPMGDENRTIGGAILGDAVTQVLGETEALVIAGAERAAVDRANAATVALRKLLNQYNSMSTDEERYMFYISAYEELKGNFNVLLRVLDYFLSFKALRGELSRRGKTEAYELLVAQLYYLCNALDNEVIANYIQEYNYDKTGGAYFDSSYGIGISKKKPASLVGTDGVLEDNNDALPLETGYPGIPEMPVMPEEVPNPGTMPTRPKLPVEPDKVEDPGNAPAEVEEPTKPTAPKTPQKYVPTTEETALVNALDGGKLPERAMLINDFDVSFVSKVSKYFRNVRRIKVNFYSDDEAQPSYTLDNVEIGTSIEYPYSAPEKSREGYTCTFDYWVDGDGKYININNLQTDKDVLDLYPHFEETPNLYDVTWIVDGEAYYDTCAYGDYPVYDEDSFISLDSVGDGVRFYRFSGWKRLSDGIIFNDGEKLPVMTTEAVQYEAVFEVSFLITWMISDTEIVYLPIWGGEMPVFDGIPQKESDDFARFVFIGWDKEIVPAVQDETYVARFKAEYFIVFDGDDSADSFGSVQRTGDMYVANCENAGSASFALGGLLDVAAENDCGVKIILSGCSIQLSTMSVYEATQSGVCGLAMEEMVVAQRTYRYSVVFTDENGDEIVPDNCSFIFTILGDFDSRNSHLTAKDSDGNKTDIRFSITDTTLTFTMRAGYVYDLCPRFSIGIIPSDYIDISISLDRAEYGDVIEIELGEPKVGMYVRSVYVIDADGNDVEVVDMTFKMPRTAVMVGVVCDYYEYTIVFKADGKILVSKKLKYGEQIVPPADPIKASDSEYQYTFEGWDKEVGYVTGDMEFNAVFTKEPLPSQPKHVSKLSKLINFVRIGVPIIIAIVFLVRFALLVVVLEEQERKRLKAQMKHGDEADDNVADAEILVADVIEGSSHHDNSSDNKEDIEVDIKAENNQLNRNTKQQNISNKKNQNRKNQTHKQNEIKPIDVDLAVTANNDSAANAQADNNKAENASAVGKKTYNKRVVKIKRKK